MYLAHYKYAVNLDTSVVDGTTVHYFPETYKRVASKLTYPVEEMAKKVVIRDLPAVDGKTAFILAAGNTNFAGIQPLEIKSELQYEYVITARTITQIFAHGQAKNYDGIHLITVDSSACASSLHACGLARDLIDFRGYARVIILALEDAVCPNSIAFFKQAGVPCPTTPSAFDSKNFNFRLSQAAITVVFERDRTDGAIVRLLDCNSASEDHPNSLGMRADGQGYVRAMQGLHDLDTQNITVVKTHGSGTVVNNVAERSAIEQCFVTSDIVCTSLKPLLGHSLGASGLLESVYLFEDLIKGRVPAILNRTEEDKLFISEDTMYSGGDILSLASGMGNVYTAAVWELL